MEEKGKGKKSDVTKDLFGNIAVFFPLSYRGGKYAFVCDLGQPKTVLSEPSDRKSTTKGKRGGDHGHALYQIQGTTPTDTTRKNDHLENDARRQVPAKPADRKDGSRLA
jgi:hypothetical protein